MTPDSEEFLRQNNVRTYHIETYNCKYFKENQNFFIFGVRCKLRYPNIDLEICWTSFLNKLTQKNYWEHGFKQNK